MGQSGVVDVVVTPIRNQKFPTNRVYFARLAIATCLFLIRPKRRFKVWFAMTLLWLILSIHISIHILGADFVISSTCQVGGARGASPAREVECSGFQTFGDFFFRRG